MKRLLLAGAAGLCLMLPSLAPASTINFEIDGSQCTVLFDPSGSGCTQLPEGGNYRSYNCRLGNPEPVIVFTVPPKYGNIPQNNEPKNNNPDPPCKTPGNCDPVTPPSCPVAFVPAPAASEMSGVALAAIALVSAVRSRRRIQA